MSTPNDRSHWSSNAIKHDALWATARHRERHRARVHVQCALDLTEQRGAPPVARDVVPRPAEHAHETVGPVPYLVSTRVLVLPTFGHGCRARNEPEAQAVALDTEPPHEGAPIHGTPERRPAAPSRGPAAFNMVTARSTGPQGRAARFQHAPAAHGVKHGWYTY